MDKSFRKTSHAKKKKKKEEEEEEDRREEKKKEEEVNTEVQTAIKKEGATVAENILQCHLGFPISNEQIRNATKNVPNIRKPRKKVG